MTTHLFEEPGTLERVVALPRDWFTDHRGWQTWRRVSRSQRHGAKSSVYVSCHGSPIISICLSGSFESRAQRQKTLQHWDFGKAGDRDRSGRVHNQVGVDVEVDARCEARANVLQGGAQPLGVRARGVFKPHSVGSGVVRSVARLPLSGSIEAKYSSRSLFR